MYLLDLLQERDMSKLQLASKEVTPSDLYLEKKYRKFLKVRKVRITYVKIIIRKNVIKYIFADYCMGVFFNGGKEDEIKMCKKWCYR